MKHKFIKQYELWQTCNNNCTFCFNKVSANTLDIEQQKKSLEFVIDNLDKVIEEHRDDDISIELIGGEFFQGQLSNPIVRDLFFKLITKLKYLGDLCLIKQVCIFVTLTIGEQEDLYKTIDILTDNKNNNFEVWVSTSYDVKGRFTEDKLSNWKKHMIKLSNYNVLKNTTMILTQLLVNKILSNEINLVDFQKTYGTTLFFKHPLPLLINGFYSRDIEDPKELYLHAKKVAIDSDSDFMPTRSSVLKVMRILNDIGILDRLMGLDYRADDLDSKFNGESWNKTIRDKDNDIESLDEAKNTCGHLLTYMCYSDNNRCLLCDKESIIYD